MSSLSSVIGRIQTALAAIVNFQKRKMKVAQNIVGPQVRAIRQLKKMSQGELAARCGALGWMDVSENTITKIETKIRCVTDVELILLARALRTKLQVLVPDHKELF
jgi:DNA-binding transcriptional regulator YiaG